MGTGEPLRSGRPADAPPRAMGVLGLVALAIVLAGCAKPDASASALPATPGPTATPSASTTASPTATPPATVQIVATGDIGSCDVETDEAVGAAVAEESAAVIALLGDLVYPNGTAETYANCFLPGWGPVLDRARPAVGNHDLMADGGAAYWSIFDDRAGEPGEGWYSYDIGAWHVVVLNSNCELIACAPGSAQHDWLVADLEASDARCVLAYWHHPMTGSGIYGRYTPADPLWVAALEGGMDLLLTGHEHHYERFAPLGADVTADSSGVPVIIVGTGGAEVRPPGPVVPGSEVLINDVFGYLRLGLAPDGYQFEFVGLDGSVLDAGSGTCR